MKTKLYLVCLTLILFYIPSYAQHSSLEEYFDSIAQIVAREYNTNVQNSILLQPIAYNETAIGTTLNQSRNGFVFHGGAGDQVTITYRSQSMRVYFQLLHYNTNLNEISILYSSPGANNRFEYRYAIPIDGVYIIRILDPNGARGGYMIQLSSDDTLELSDDVILEMGEPIITNEEVVQVLGSETIELNNCNGTGDLIRRTRIQQSRTREVQVLSEMGIEFEGRSSIILAGVRAQTQFLTGNIDLKSNTILIDDEVEMRATERTSVTYVIDWVEKEIAGTIDVIYQDETIPIEFITNDIDVIIRDNYQTICD